MRAAADPAARGAADAAGRSWVCCRGPGSSACIRRRAGRLRPMRSAVRSSPCGGRTPRVCSWRPSHEPSGGRARAVALAGNPNVGKSSLFNALTGLHQHTGNWPGKTVAVAQGEYAYAAARYVVTDLPGAYSLTTGSGGGAYRRGLPARAYGRLSGRRLRRDLSGAEPAVCRPADAALAARDRLRQSDG